MTGKLIGVVGVGLLLASLAPLACSSFSGDGQGDQPDGGPTVDDSSTGADTTIPGEPDRGLTIDLGPTAYVVQGRSFDVPVTLTRKSSNTGDVTVTVMGLPGKVTADPLTIPHGQLSGKLTLRAAADAAQGQTPLKVLAEEANATALGDLAVFVRGTPGALDTTFGNTGMLDVFIGDSTVQDVKVLSDGSIFAAGTRANTAAVIKYKGDGTIDTAFGSNGIVVITQSQLGGRIALYDPPAPAKGYIYFLGGPSVGSLTLYRSNLDGTTDTTFGGGTGSVLVTDGLTANPTHLGARVEAMADGKALVLAYNGTATRLTRWNTDGTQDTGFASANGGYFELPVSQNVQLIVRPGGAPLLFNGGTVTGLLASGAGDPSIGDAPTFSAPVPAGAPTRSPNGSFFFFSNSSPETTWKHTSPTFVVDMTIGVLGNVPGPSNFVGSPLAELDNSLLLVGANADSAIRAFHAKADSSYDPDFGTNGLASYPLPDGATAQVNAFAQQADGRIVVVGKNQHTFGGFILRFWP